MVASDVLVNWSMEDRWHRLALGFLIGFFCYRLLPPSRLPSLQVFPLNTDPTIDNLIFLHEHWMQETMASDARRRIMMERDEVILQLTKLSQLSLVGSSLFAATALRPRQTQNYSDNNSKAKRFKLYLTIGCIPQNILIVDSTFRKSFSKAKRGAPAYLRAHVCASSFTSVHAAWSQLISFFLARELLSYLSIIKTCLLFNWPPIDDDLSASVTSDLLVTDSILTRIPCTKSASLKTKCVSHGRYRKLIPMTWSYRKLGVKRF